MAFWKKIFKSKYTGAEIDAAVAKAGSLPATTSADAGKALVVDSEGKIVPGEVGGDIAFVHISYNDQDELIADKTFDEIVALIESGKIVCASYNSHLCNLTIKIRNAVGFLSPIESLSPEDHTIEQTLITITNLNVITVEYVSTVVTSITIES